MQIPAHCIHCAPLKPNQWSPPANGPTSLHPHTSGQFERWLGKSVYWRHKRRRAWLSCCAYWIADGRVSHWLRARCVIRTGSISVYPAAAHVMPDHPTVLNDVIPFQRKGT